MPGENRKYRSLPQPSWRPRHRLAREGPCAKAPMSRGPRHRAKQPSAKCAGVEPPPARTRASSNDRVAYPPCDDGNDATPRSSHHPPDALGRRSCNHHRGIPGKRKQAWPALEQNRYKGRSLLKQCGCSTARSGTLWGKSAPEEAQACGVERSGGECGGAEELQWGCFVMR